MTRESLSNLIFSNYFRLDSVESIALIVPTLKLKDSELTFVLPLMRHAPAALALSSEDLGSRLVVSSIPGYFSIALRRNGALHAN